MAKHVNGRPYFMSKQGQHWLSPMDYFMEDRTSKLYSYEFYACGMDVMIVWDGESEKAWAPFPNPTVEGWLEYVGTDLTVRIREDRAPKPVDPREFDNLHWDER